MTAQPTQADAIAEIAASPAGPQIGAFFDLDGTLVDGFTATAHASDRIRRRQARIGEVLGVIEASARYRFGRMRFEHLLTRAAGYLRGESLAELDEQSLAEFVEIADGVAVQHPGALANEVLELRASQLVVEPGLHHADELADAHLAAPKSVLGLSLIHI